MCSSQWLKQIINTEWFAAEQASIYWNIDHLIATEEIMESNKNTPTTEKEQLENAINGRFWAQKKNVKKILKLRKKFEKQMGFSMQFNTKRRSA